MSSKKTEIKELNISELRDERFMIPIYQRNYAWQESEISQLIDDVWQAQKQGKSTYYLGSLIVYSREDGRKEVIDGQQRLTTLMLILKYLETQEQINLAFSHRPKTNEILSKIHNNMDSYADNNLEQGFRIIKNKFEIKNDVLNEDGEVLDKQEFAKFLLNNVIVIYTEVPKETDLNHYFEIMNNRGEQLEKHEIIKARLLEKIKEDKEEPSEPKEDKNAVGLFSMIWDACANMNNFVIQNVPANERESLFGQFAQIIPNKFSKLSEQEKQEEKVSIFDLIKTPHQAKEGEDKTSAKEKFSSIVDFPSFLMFALKVYVDENVSLDDKKLISAFDDLNNQIEAKEFIINLLKLRLLFDRFIIKSDNEYNWQLRGVKRYSNGNCSDLPTFGKALNELKDLESDDEKDDLSLDNSEILQKEILQILSMFHVSFKQRNYKTWLFEVLEWLNKKSSYTDINDKDYLLFLENKAKDYYAKRAKDLHNGTGTPHYLFNFLDYILWKDKETDWEKLKVYGVTKEKFRFSMSGNSVEHYLAQNYQENLQDQVLSDNFGNLCLISNYQNSSLLDKTPESKRGRYLEGEGKYRLECQSIKQAVMFSKDKWSEEEIQQHSEEMIEKINQFLNLK